MAVDTIRHDPRARAPLAIPTRTFDRYSTYTREILIFLLFPSVSLSFLLTASLYLSLTTRLYISISLSPSLSLPLCFSLSLSLSFCLSLPLFLSLFLNLYLSLCALALLFSHFLLEDLMTILLFVAKTDPSCLSSSPLNSGWYQAKCEKHYFYY